MIYDIFRKENTSVNICVNLWPTGLRTFFQPRMYTDEIKGCKSFGVSQEFTQASDLSACFCVNRRLTAFFRFIVIVVDLLAQQPVFHAVVQQLAELRGLSPDPVSC
jgi:hypothetical protein